MGLRILSRIKLPYIIRMKESEIIKTQLPATKEFSEFKVTLFPNRETNDELYNPQYSDNNSFYIEVEALTELYSHEKYENSDSSLYSIYNVPENDQIIIFKMLKDRLNEFLYFLSEMTQMFWIEELTLNPISGAISKRTDFVFLHPNLKIDGNSRLWNTYNDDYQTDLRLMPVKSLSKEIVDEFGETYIIRDVWTEYRNKAKRALFSSEYIDFIIYSAIEAESFIKKTVNFLQGRKPEKDVVLAKLIETGKNNFVESYYKVILRYITGKSLNEVDPTLYSNLISIYRLRNAVMHQGEIKVKDFKNAGLGEIESLEFDICLEIYNKLQKAIQEMLTYV